MIGIVDHIEGQFIVLEIEGVTRDVKRNQVAGDVAAGDVLLFQNGMWHKDQQATAERTDKIKKLMDSVWED